MKLRVFAAFAAFLICIATNSCKQETTTIQKSENLGSTKNEDIRQYYFQTLDSATHYAKKIDTLQTLEANQRNFLKSREWYKRAEPMLIAYDYENYLSINAPNLLKVEMEDFTDIKKRKPKSYQVMEELLYGEDNIPKSELYLVSEYLKIRLPFIRKNHIIYRQVDRHHLKMIRDAIVNVATKGITGFDSPMLSNSLAEAIYNYQTIQKVLEFYKDSFKDKNLYATWQTELKSTIKTLNQGDFDTFDRYSFIKNHTNAQLELINETAQDWNVKLNTSRALNPTATNLFAADFFNLKMFALQGSPAITEERIALGRMLFNDPALSDSKTMSCATCHIKEKAFTDGHAKAVGKNGQELQRNTPPLSYAVYQRTFFYDGRGDGLEGQIVGVVNNENEFHMDLRTMEERVRENPKYKPHFDTLYDGEMSNNNVRNAIATYIRSLAPFDSKFDRNMQDLENTLTDVEQHGFNLFMGKAACATCHFPPAFFGTVPPKYDETEFENLGVPKNADFDAPVLDDDPGLFYPFEVEEKRHFFKTATVRNAELTGPYMHNGVYKTLKEVMQFYNVGGGQGMGLDVPYQTLPPDSLNLDEKEIDAIISFMKTLTDAEFQVETTP